MIKAKPPDFLEWWQTYRRRLLHHRRRRHRHHSNSIKIQGTCKVSDKTEDLFTSASS